MTNGDQVRFIHPLPLSFDPGSVKFRELLVDSYFLEVYFSRIVLLRGSPDQQESTLSGHIHLPDVYTYQDPAYSWTVSFFKKLLGMLASFPDEQHLQAFILRTDYYEKRELLTIKDWPPYTAFSKSRTEVIAQCFGA